MNLKCEGLLALEMEDESKADPFALFKLEASELGLEGDERAKYIQDRAIEEAEWEAWQREREEKAEREAEMERLKLKEGMGGIVAGNARSVSTPVASWPMLPHFDESHDEMDSYLFRFEKYAVAVGWPKEDWATLLSALLNGKALTTYHELALRDSSSYDELKEALLQTFQYSVEGYRTTFRNLRPQQGESMLSYLSHLRHQLDRWIDFSQIETMDGLKDLILREQVLSTCSAGLVTFLKEREQTSVQALIENAERYREAHPLESMAAKSGDVWSAAVTVPTAGQTESKPSVYYASRGQGLPHLDSGKGPRCPHAKAKPPEAKRKSGAVIVCWLCNKRGHRIRDCRERTAFKQVTTAVTASSVDPSAATTRVRIPGTRFEGVEVVGDARRMNQAVRTEKVVTADVRAVNPVVRTEKVVAGACQFFMS